MLHLLDRVLRLSWYLLIGLTALAAIGIGWAFFLSDSPVNLDIWSSPLSVEAFKDITGAEDVAVNATDHVVIESVVFTSSDPAITWPMVALIGLGIALFLYGYRLLQHVVSSAVRDDPFTPANVVRIRKMALVALGMFVLDALTPLMSAALAAIRLRGQDFHAMFTLDGDLAGFIVVLLLLALAEVFARGVELREETELTI